MQMQMQMQMPMRKIDVKAGGTYLVGVDAGTTLVKSIVCDLNGGIVASSGKEILFEYPKPGWVEQDPEEIWRAATGTIKKAIEESKVSPEEIRGISIAGQMNCSFLIDKEGKPARTKGISWLDARDQKIELLEKWKREGTLEWIYKKAGIPVITSMPLMHLCWLAKNEPETLRKAKTHLGCKDWIRYKLAGEESRFMDHTGASATGFFNPRELKWERELFELAGVDPSLFPPTRGSWEWAGAITDEASRLTGLNKGTPVAVGAGDVCAASLGAGCTENG
jgi:sugar (pentulose or hexulose) kinase